jgi:hypothetical protein
MGVYNYLTDPVMNALYHSIESSASSGAWTIARHLPGAPSYFGNKWDEFHADFTGVVSANMQQWLLDRISLAIYIYRRHETPDRERMLGMLYSYLPFVEKITRW